MPPEPGGGSLLTTRIVFNGKEYASPEAMPPEVRQAYQRLLAELGDKDKDGIPDIVQHGGKTNVLGVTKTNITINGKSYGSPAEMPPEVRTLYDTAMAQAGAPGGGISASLGPGGKSNQVRLAYTLKGGSGEGSSGGSRTILLLVIGAVVGGVVMWWLMAGR
jgi:hypothetical protein